MASLLPSLAIVAIEPNGLPEEFASHYAPPRLRTRPRRSLSNKLGGNRRRLRLHSGVSHQQPKIILVDSQEQDKQEEDDDDVAEEQDLVRVEVEEERVPPPPPIDPPSPEHPITVSTTRTSSSRRGFFRKSSSASSSGRFRLFTGGRKSSVEKVITHRKRNPADGVTVSTSMTKSPSYKSTSGQGSAALLLAEDDIMVDDVVCFPKGDDFFDKRSTASSRGRSSSLSGSMANRSVSGRSYGTSGSRRSKRSTTARLIRVPVLKNDFSDDDDDDGLSGDIVDKDDATQESRPSSANDDDDDGGEESRQDEEMNWLAGDRTTISSVGGGGRSHAGVDSIIGDPTEVCGLLEEVMYRDFRNFLSGLSNPHNRLIGYQEFPGTGCGPVVEFTRSNETTSVDGEFHHGDD